MRYLVLGIVGVLLAGCATEAEREASRMREATTSANPAIEACDRRLEQSTPYQALKNRIGPRTGPIPLALKANQEKASPREVTEVFALHQEYMMPCRTLMLESLAQVHPALVGVIAEYYSKLDAALVQLTNRQTTWGQFVTQKDAINAEAKAKFAAMSAEIQKNLDQANASEAARGNRRQTRWRNGPINSKCCSKGSRWSMP